ncbi:hypothetical protein [Burkholderia ambifaria]|uniref:Uncharacterized protein n=1 Tax=Burkholderia ambifaria MEX-5 TaxID=396597 RepID=B1TF49_9BURK|nr:hypothetical protein [Burkholderia ambifaria]EDT37808.1 hypothetical protein BamMEX5DRAFT_6415 [Burkholderia ambifaria MEX-5]
MYASHSHRRQLSEQNTRRPPTPPPDYDGADNSHSKCSYIFFPRFDAERASLLIQCNLWRVDKQGKPPYIAVIGQSEQTTFSRLISEIAQTKNVSALRLKTLFPTTPDLRGVSAPDKVYVDGHGDPGQSYFYSSNGDRFYTCDVARALVKLHLPDNVEVRTTACWGGSTKEIHFPWHEKLQMESSEKMRALHAHIESNYGCFEHTLAGALEHSLRLRQANRPSGLVSGYIGKVTTVANSTEKLRIGDNGNGELAKEHAEAAFPMLGSSDLLSLRRSDVRRSAVGLSSKVNRPEFCGGSNS